MSKLPEMMASTPPASSSPGLLRPVTGRPAGPPKWLSAEGETLECANERSDAEGDPASPQCPDALCHGYIGEVLGLQVGPSFSPTGTARIAATVFVKTKLEGNRIRRSLAGSPCISQCRKLPCYRRSSMAAGGKGTHVHEAPGALPAAGVLGGEAIRPQ